MKHLTRLLAFGLLLAVSAWPALAQDGGTAATTAATAQDDEACNELYRVFYDKQQKKDIDGAYETAKEYLQKCSADNAYRKAADKFVKAYDIKKRRTQFYAALKAENFDEAFGVGKQVLVDTPDDPQIIYDLTRAGRAAALAVTPNEKNNAEAATYAKRSIELTNSGKLPNKSTTKDTALGEAYYTLGVVLDKPEEQIPNLIKTAQTQVYGKDPGVYFKLALAYQEGEYTKSDQAYKDAVAKYKDADNPEVKAALKSYQQSADRLIDALARTIVFANTTEYAPYKDLSTPLITGLYKFRNKTDAGMPAFITGITAKPIPQPGQPIDYFPPPVAATTPGTGGTGTMPATGTTPAIGTTPANGTKPAVKPPTKPKPKPKPKGKKG